ncbi:MAG TPA: hypothetical protein VIW64_16235 [Pyrinomonadaceae bacterium]|jgi:hypothetical protein
MANQNQLGFGGQWVDGTPIGTHRDSDGDIVKIDTAFLEAVVRNYDPKLHEAPMVIDHPESDGPAYGYVAELRVNNGRLERRFSQVQPEFEEIVRRGLFKKRSDAFYLDPKDSPNGKAPYLRHCGFLGAKVPAIKGIADIQFSEDEGKTVDVEVDTAINFSEGATMTDAEKKAAEDAVKKTAREAVTDLLKGMFKADDKPATAAFTEADQKRLVEDAVTAATAKFSEELKTRDTKIEELTRQVDSQTGGSRRREIAAFCESVGVEKMIPAFKSMGIVEFMETLEDTPKTKKVTVITFAEGDKEEKKEISQLEWMKNFVSAFPQFVKFGEDFGGLRLKGDGGEIANPHDKKILRESMGVKAPELSAAKS